MPTTRLFIEIPPAPCDYDCPLWDVCDYFELACEQFALYVDLGRRQQPPKQTEPIPATREIYDDIFIEKKSKK